mgnify:CR=1 FL=1
MNQKAATQEDAIAQFNLGRKYYNGNGVKKDYLKAKELWEKAADQGNVDAQMNLGILRKQTLFLS